MSYMLKYFLKSSVFKQLYRPSKIVFYMGNNNFSYTQLSFVLLLQKDFILNMMILMVFFFFFFKKIFISVLGFFSHFFFFFFKKILMSFPCFFLKLFFVFHNFYHYIFIIKNFLIITNRFYIYIKNFFLQASKYDLCISQGSLEFLFMNYFKYNIFCFHKFSKNVSEYIRTENPGYKITWNYSKII